MIGHAVFVTVLALLAWRAPAPADGVFLTLLAGWLGLALATARWDRDA